VTSLAVETALHEIGSKIIAKISIPKDQWEVAAQLEVMGLRDEDAQTEFGCHDIFDLARRIMWMFNEGAFPIALEKHYPSKKESFLSRWFRHYLNGLMLSLPTAVQAATMLVWGYGVWGAIELDARNSTAIALGFFASYAITGGFCQTIVRRGLFYIYQEEDYLARSTVLRIWWISVAIVAGLLIPFLLFNLLYEFLPWDMFGVMCFYYIALSILWLNFSLMYLARKSYLFVVVIAAGLLVAVFAAEVLGATVMQANGAALFIVDVASFFISAANLARRVEKRGVTRLITPPRLTILVYSTSLFFFYGALYNIFLFTDRLLAWTSAKGRGDYLPYPIWVDGPYELGMDLALLNIILLMGVVEHITQRFSEGLIANQKSVRSTSSDEFNRRYGRYHWNRMIVLAIAGIVSLLLSGLVFYLLRRFGSSEVMPGRNLSGVVRNVFWLASISYVFFMAALSNVLILLSLSRVNLVLRVVSASIVVNVIVGFVCSRSIHYSLSAVGLLAGTFVFLVLSTLVTNRVMSRLDYYYYSAY